LRPGLVLYNADGAVLVQADIWNIDGKGAPREQMCGTLKGRSSQRAYIQNVKGEGAPGEQTCGMSKGRGSQRADLRHLQHQKGRRSRSIHAMCNKGRRTY